MSVVRDAEKVIAKAILERYGNQKDRTVSNAAVRDALFIENLKPVLRSVFSALKLKRSGYAIRDHRHRPRRIHNLGISDTHFHSLLDSREVGSAYGPTEEARRFGKVVTDTCEFKPRYRNDTELFVHVAGDLIEGDLHDHREAATQTEQFGAAAFYLIQAAQAFSKAFPRVTFRCVPGNHGRNKRRHPERAVSQKWDSFENMVYLAFKYATASLPNVRVEIPYSPYYTYRSFNKTGFVTHGDTVLDVGFPSETINIKKIRNQINEWNAGATHHDLFFVGHVHCGALVHIPSGPTFLSNSCLVPPNSYAISRGISRAKCGQWLWEAVPDHICGDSRFLVVDETTDKDRYYERVIRPFEGFETPIT